VSDPGWARESCPRARFRVAHASVPGGPYVAENAGGFLLQDRV
jgi:hypothetical protein